MGRWGGEEFVALLPEIGREALPSVAEKLRGAVEQSPLVIEEGEKKILYSVSLGGAVFDPSMIEWMDLFREADKALYQAKELGRNRFYMI